MARRLEQERSEYDRLMASVEQLYRQGALAADDSAQAVFVEGAANLVAGEQDRQRLQELLKTLEEKQKIVELLGAYLDAKQEAVRVVIGLDQALPSMRNFVLIGAPARVGGEVMGSLAVIGPTRIDYQHTMTAVSYIARLFDKILERIGVSNLSVYGKNKRKIGSGRITNSMRSMSCRHQTTGGRRITRRASLSAHVRRWRANCKTQGGARHAGGSPGAPAG